MSPVFISFYTSEYEREAAGLVETLEQHGLAYDVETAPDLGRWVLNCGQKAAFVRDKRALYHGRPVVWIDADARVARPPTLFAGLACDLAAHRLRGEELLSGTLYFGPTRAAAELVEAWCARQQASPNVWDQRVLAQAVAACPGLRVVDLPPEYAWIQAPGFDVDADISGVAYGRREPVIVHGQASRRLRRD